MTKLKEKWTSRCFPSNCVQQCCHQANITASHSQTEKKPDWNLCHLNGKCSLAETEPSLVKPASAQPITLAFTLCWKLLWIRNSNSCEQRFREHSNLMKIKKKQLNFSIVKITVDCLFLFPFLILLTTTSVQFQHMLSNESPLAIWFSWSSGREFPEGDPRLTHPTVIISVQPVFPSPSCSSFLKLTLGNNMLGATHPCFPGRLRGPCFPSSASPIADTVSDANRRKEEATIPLLS